ncbi:MAG TPA: hypothetical protein K8W01_04600 [Methylorubrum populi]|uniref:Uncharacterized protein n=1 Tax=Methylorubrum populi TaxID=223967 RepID=A0A921E0H6_9HYPH|nr:hypothetical protein [Methylorubrum populi]
MARRSEPCREPAPSPPPPTKPRRSRKRTPHPQRLRSRLLAQIERQIDRFDAALNAEPPPAGLDSGKVLRDLGGLKNLLDDMRTADRAAEGGGGDGASGSPALSVADLVAMRTDIARRYAAFAAAEPDDGLSDPPLAGAASPA